MKLQWLICVLKKRRARFFPWDVLVPEFEGRMDARHSQPKSVEEPASSATGVGRAKRGGRSTRFARPVLRNGHAAGRSYGQRALKMSGRRSLDALRPNRVN